MKDFLISVAEDIIRRYGTDLTHVAVVFPNKRASLFLNEHLAHAAGQPLWSPVYITISDLFRRQSNLTVADPIKLVCELYKSYCHCTGSEESLDRFYGWGQLLLADFDDLDKNMADADHVFANLRDLHELDDLSYLTQEQREILRRFFSSFSEHADSELKERFLRLWSRLADIYHDFNQRLEAQGLAYEGALYRRVVQEMENSDNLATRYPFEHYLFVGFNLLQRVEQQLFSRLMHDGKAQFYWDFDHYYLHGHEAGQYIARYLKQFPNDLDNADSSLYDNLSGEKHITYVAASSDDIQARYVCQWLREKKRFSDGRRTAIVLCDEALLPTVVHSLPPEVDLLNITTGYPLMQTPIASLLKLLTDMQLSNRRYGLLRSVRRHPYAAYADDSLLTAELPSLAAQTMLEWLMQLVRQMARHAAEADAAKPLLQETLFTAYTLLNRLYGLVTSGDLTIDANTLQRLLMQCVAQSSIPFHGEPAEGIQLMGVLETRNIDFDHVLLLSCGEGFIPRGVGDQSFIPHSIRQANGLTTIDNKVSIYAYYFHRLLQRAGDITMVYNSSTEDGHTGQMSRFMLQLLVESRHTIRRITLQSALPLTVSPPQPIDKSPQVLDILCSQESHLARHLTPSALNRYLRCPLQFYYRYVAEIVEPQEDPDRQELDSRIFGNVFHDAAEQLYRKLPRQVDKTILEHLLKSRVEIERAVDEAFHEQLPQAPVTGLYIIQREVVIHYLRQLVNIDCRLAPFTILGLEKDVWREIQVNDHNLKFYIGGRVDRIDLVGDRYIRVVDYKTGSSRLKVLPDIEAIFSPDNIHDHSDYYLQALLYSDIVRRKSQYPVVPALLFIQHAGGDDYDPTLQLAQQPISDVAEHSEKYCRLLDAMVREIFSSDTPFVPTQDRRTCQYCPYASLCR